MRRRMAGRSLSSVIDFGVLICLGSHAGLQLACEFSLINFSCLCIPLYIERECMVYTRPRISVI
jgi:hypothetical protein